MECAASSSSMISQRVPQAITGNRDQNWRKGLKGEPTEYRAAV
jgi:hypothetical protein